MAKEVFEPPPPLAALPLLVDMVHGFGPRSRSCVPGIRERDEARLRRVSWLVFNKACFCARLGAPLGGGVPPCLGDSRHLRHGYVGATRTLGGGAGRRYVGRRSPVGDEGRRAE